MSTDSAPGFWINKCQLFFWGGEVVASAHSGGGGGVLQDSAWELHAACPVQHCPPPTGGA